MMKGPYLLRAGVWGEYNLCGGRRGNIEGTVLQEIQLGMKEAISCRKFRMGWKCVCMLLKKGVTAMLCVWGGRVVTYQISSSLVWYFVWNGRGGGRCERHTINFYKCHLGKMCGILEYLAQPFQCDCHIIILLDISRWDLQPAYLALCLS